MDDDGVDLDRPVPLKVRIEVKGDSMTVDLSGVSPQVKGFYNSRAGVGAVQVALKCLALSEDFPINDGGFRPLKVNVPLGTVVNAVKPAPMRAWMCYPMTIIDTIFRALSPVIPDRTIAGHHADLLTAHINGISPKDGKMYLYLGGLIGGGWGAKASEDGVCGTIAINDGDTHNGPSEQVENKHPLLVEKYGLRPDSGGAGKFRGGLGTEQIVRCLAPINFNTRIDHVKNPPLGLQGGLPGAGNQVAVRRVTGEEVIFPNGKVSVRVDAGEAYIIRGGGGGGFGLPQERSLNALQSDVSQGYVTKSGAEKFYDVKI